MNVWHRFLHDALCGNTGDKRYAVDRRLGIVFRPLAGGDDGRIKGFEALVRTSSQEAPGRADKVFQTLAHALHVETQARERYDWQGQRLERAAFQLAHDAPPWDQVVATLQRLCQAQGLRCVSSLSAGGQAPTGPKVLQGALVFGR
ncbi:MAG: hypothetical protein CFE44_02260 [Burkholderiales bacterium PBB4]|nr:MAG: hypothetical protein CFE44_02260 [Burkholderiales bacterium PBB4]